eukprot:6190856-Pleurochrysis_carterae.AAC.5
MLRRYGGDTVTEHGGGGTLALGNSEGGMWRCGSLVVYRWVVAADRMWRVAAIWRFLGGGCAAGSMAYREPDVVVACTGCRRSVREIGS